MLQAQSWSLHALLEGDPRSSTEDQFSGVEPQVPLKSAFYWAPTLSQPNWGGPLWRSHWSLAEHYLKKCAVMPMIAYQVAGLSSEQGPKILEVFQQWTSLETLPVYEELLGMPPSPLFFHQQWQCYPHARNPGSKHHGWGQRSAFCSGSAKRDWHSLLTKTGQAQKTKPQIL